MHCQIWQAVAVRYRIKKRQEQDRKDILRAELDSHAWQRKGSSCRCSCCCCCCLICHGLTNDFVSVSSSFPVVGYATFPRIRRGRQMDATVMTELGLVCYQERERSVSFPFQCRRNSIQSHPAGPAGTRWGRFQPASGRSEPAGQLNILLFLVRIKIKINSPH